MYRAYFHRKGEPNSKIQTTNLIRLLKRRNIEAIDVEVSSIDEITSKAQELAKTVDLYVSTTDTLMQNGGEDALISVSKQRKIPILSSNKKGIQKGSTFGPVSDFYQLGKMSGKKAAKILLTDVQPTQLESNLQEKPIFLINVDSARLMGIPIDSTRSDKYQLHQ